MSAGELVLPPTFAQDLAERQAVVQEGIREFSAMLLGSNSPQETDPLTYTALTAADDLLLSPKSKNLRGMLVTEGFRIGLHATGQEETPAHRSAMAAAAAVVEATQTAILIEDDLFDGADQRRGLPTVHTILKEKLAREEGLAPEAAAVVARNYTVNAATILQYEAHAALNLVSVDDTALRSASYLFNRSMVRTGRGQGWDMLPAGKGAGREYALRVARDKTAHYTKVGPLQFGAALAGMPVDKLSEFEPFALPAGIAFQLQDDLISTIGNPRVTGKDQMLDIRDGKETLLVDEARERANERQLAVLSRTIGNAALSPAEFQDCLAVLHETGAVSAVERVIQQLTTQAVDAIPAHWPEKQQTFLRGVAIYGTQRRK